MTPFEEDAFKEQVRRHQDSVYGFAYYFLGRREEAEDVTQDVLLQLWKRGRGIKPASRRAWLLSVTRNACIDRLRRRQLERRLLSADPDGVARASSPAPSPHARCEGADIARHLRRALARLDEPQRSLVILREIQHLSYKEISAALDLPMSTVKVYLHRGRKKLRHHLADVTNHELA